MKTTRPSLLALFAALSLSLSFAACGGESVVADDDEATMEEPGQDESALVALRPLVNEGWVTSREAWGARAPGNCRPLETPTRITIHHAGGPVGDPIAWLRSVDYETRVRRGWCDLMYHFAIAQDGRVFEMVSSGRRGAHVDSQNVKNLGIVLMGNFEYEQPSSAMIASLQKVLAGMNRHYGIGLDRAAIKGHFQLAQTACPGANVRGRLDSIVAGAGSSPSQPAPAAVEALTFDPEFYLLLYPDLQAAFGWDFGAARDHWNNFGLPEGRQGSPLFWAPHYLAANPDVAQAFGAANYQAAAAHWLTYGVREGRASSTVFDVRYYLGLHSDLQAAFGGTNYAAAADHYARFGLVEGRRGSPSFDAGYYLAHHSDLQAAFGSNFRAGIAHWLTFGQFEGRAAVP